MDDKTTIVVGLGELKVSRDPSVVLTCMGLGSSIAVCAYDRVSKVGGMAHVMLPSSGGKHGTGSAKFADIAIPLLLQEMAKQGGGRSRLIVKLVGGAQLSLAPGLINSFKTAERNVAEVEAALARERIPIAAADTGGNMGRTVRMSLDTGKVLVKSGGGEAKELLKPFEVARKKQVATPATPAARVAPAAPASSQGYAMDDREYSYLTKKILALIGIDLSYYKSGQMRRRLDGLIDRHNVGGVMPYCEMLEQDENALNKLRDFLTINVSEFFRDSNHFETLETVMLPELLRHSPNLKVWSAGCSIGAEPYSVAMMLEKLAPHGAHKILATDIDDSSLMKAIAGGPYSPADVKSVPQQVLKKYFTSSDKGYTVIDRIRPKVQFSKHDLLHDPFEQHLDLIICRNVVIYFSDEAKRRLNQKFYESLNENGVLFIGGTETMLDANETGFQRLYPCFWGKPAVSAQQKAPAPIGAPSKI